MQATIKITQKGKTALHECFLDGQLVGKRSSKTRNYDFALVVRFRNPEAFAKFHNWYEKFDVTGSWDQAFVYSWHMSRQHAQLNGYLSQFLAVVAVAGR